MAQIITFPTDIDRDWKRLAQIMRETMFARAYPSHAVAEILAAVERRYRATMRPVPVQVEAPAECMPAVLKANRALAEAVQTLLGDTWMQVFAAEADLYAARHPEAAGA